MHEFKCVFLAGADKNSLSYEELLNMQGAEGWQLVGIIQDIGGFGQPLRTFVLTREKTE